MLLALTRMWLVAAALVVVLAVTLLQAPDATASGAPTTLQLRPLAAPQVEEFEPQEPAGESLADESEWSESEPPESESPAPESPELEPEQAVPGATLCRHRPGRS